MDYASVPLASLGEEVIASNLSAQASQNISVGVQNVTTVFTESIVQEPSLWQSPWVWFIIGAVFAVALYLLIDYIRKR